MNKVRMRRGVPTRSFRQDAAMAGAIFMSNAESRQQCFRLNIFGLPLEYESFVNNVKEGMPLFLFDHTERKLYGVFEAASDGGLNINRSAFRSIGRSYPAQVCFKIVWKCRPLTEDEFSLAIEENYYMSKKFYFDLSYQQVVRLYGLFDKMRVEHPICNYPKSANLEKEQSSKGTPDKRSLTPNISPFSADQSHILMSSSTSKVSTVETNYSALTSMHPIVPLRVERQPNVSMPLGTKLFGVQIAPIRSSHHGQIEPYHSNELFQDASTVDGISTQVSSPCSQTTRNHRDQLVANHSYPLPHDYPHNSLSSGCMTRDPTDGVRLSANQSYPLPHDYPHNSLSSGCMTRDPTDGVRLSANQSYSSSLGYVRSSLLSPQYITQDPTGRDRNYVSSTYTLYAPSYPHFSLANPQGNANWKDHYDIHCNQCRFGPHEDIFASEHQYLSKGKSLTPPKLSQQGIPAYPEAPVVSAIGQRTESSTDCISIPHCDEGFENDKWKHGFNCNASGSSGHGNDSRAYMSEQLHTNHDIGAESNTIVPGQCRQRSVFSRLSLNQQPPSEEITGPSLNQLLQSLSQRTKQWSSENRALTDDVGRQLVGEQVMDRPCPLAELNLPSLLGGEESTEPPFLNFKRRSEAGKLDANLGKEISGKVKRRKLVRPPFGEDNNAASSGKELQGNGVEDRRHSHVEVGGNKLNIDLNRPATVDSDLVEEDGSIVLCPAVVIKIQTEKPCEVNTNKPNCSNAMGVICKQDPSLDNGITAEKVSLDLNVADLDTMDESKPQAILGSSLLQALGKLRSGSPNNSEEARSSICVEDRKVNMAMNSDGNTKPRGN